MNQRIKISLFLILSLLPACANFAAEPLPAFPGAEGFGRFTSGGRGGQVIKVTNLNDDGPGSLRAAIKTRGPRIVIFTVSGTIALKSKLVINKGDLTIAGQTAPGDGICLRDHPLIIEADNVILRYLRVRLGDRHKLEEDAASVIFRKNILIDHCSFSWGIDEVLSVRDNANSTVQWCVISESLHNSFHHKGPHGYGGIWGGKGVSFHHNLIAHHASRNPRFNGSRYHKKPQEEIVDFRNNVIYNWGFNSAYGGEMGQQNIIANYFKSGPASEVRDRIVEPWDDQGRWFIADNFVEGYPAITQDNWAGGVQGKFWQNVRVDAPFVVAPIETQTAEEAFALVLERAGATLPKRDAVDLRLVKEVKSGTVAVRNGIIDSQEQVGGWPELLSASPPLDTDDDGMPNDWEKAQQFDPLRPDNNGDADGDGYTNIEEYLNWLCETNQQK